MKSKIVYVVLLLLNCGMAQAEYSYSDAVRIYTRVGAIRRIVLSSDGLKAPDDLNAVSPLLVASYHFIPSGKLEKINKYNGWYNEKVRNVQPMRKAAITQLVEPVIFLGADYALEKLADVASETAAAQAVKQVIPAQYRIFTGENGKFVLASAGARLVGTLANNEPLSDNVKFFGANTAIQVTANGLETYAINPKLDQWMGTEDSTGKSLAKGVANGLVVLLMNSLLSKAVS